MSNKHNKRRSYCSCFSGLRRSLHGDNGIEKAVPHVVGEGEQGLLPVPGPVEVYVKRMSLLSIGR